MVGSRLHNQEMPSINEYNSDANAYVEYRLKNLQKILQYNAPPNRTAAPSMEYIVDVLYALQHLYTIPHGVPKRTYQSMLMRWNLYPFQRSVYASKINAIMSPYSFLFMRDGAFVELPTTQHLELYYAFTNYFLGIAKENNFIIADPSDKRDFTEFLTDVAYKTKFTSYAAAITTKSKDIVMFLNEPIFKTVYTEATAVQAESTARQTFFFYFFVTLLLPLSVETLNNATYDRLVDALLNQNANVLLKTSYHRHIFNEAKRMVKTIQNT